MTSSRRYIAFDIGASNGRCVLGTFDGGVLSLEVLSRFENGYVRTLDHYYWDILRLFDNVKLGLRQAAEAYRDDLVGIGVDSWGLDFALLDRAGEMIGNPYCYRDPHTEGMMEEAFRRVSREEIFQTTGLQFMIINTLYHLLAMATADLPALESARTFLMIPDLINYWLTGRAACEYTNTSNTQLLDARQRQWAFPLIKAMGIPEQIFPEILEPGQVLAPVRQSAREETGLPPLPVIATVTADTGAAVASVPAISGDFAYLSSGTWGLMGVEVPEPILSDKVLHYNFGNEGGVFNTIRLLRNIPNLWLLQECRRIWALKGDAYSWKTLVAMARQSEPFCAFIDSDAEQFLRPSDMPALIRETSKTTGQTMPGDRAAIVRLILDSLAFKYRHTLEKLTDILGRAPEVLHIVGGGARNKLLCQLAANACNVPVVAGPAEATALGNIMLQMIANGDLAGHTEGRELIRESFPTETYTPLDTEIWEAEYERFLTVTGLPVIL